MRSHETCRTVPKNKLSHEYVWSSDGAPDGVIVTLGWCELVPALAEAGDADLKLMALRPTAETGHEMSVRMQNGRVSLKTTFLHSVICRRHPHLCFVYPETRKGLDACGRRHRLRCRETVGAISKPKLIAADKRLSRNMNSKRNLPLAKASDLWRIDDQPSVMEDCGKISRCSPGCGLPLCSASSET